MVEVSLIMISPGLWWDALALSSPLSCPLAYTEHMVTIFPGSEPTHKLSTTDYTDQAPIVFNLTSGH